MTVPARPPSAAALEAAYDAGVAARVTGLPLNACPFDVRRERALVHAWCNGYGHRVDDAPARARD